MIFDPIQTQCVRNLDILKFHLFVLHDTDTFSFPLSNSRFLRYNETTMFHQNPLVQHTGSEDSRSQNMSSDRYEGTDGSAPTTRPMGHNLIFFQTTPSSSSPLSFLSFIFSISLSVSPFPSVPSVLTPPPHSLPLFLPVSQAPRAKYTCHHLKWVRVFLSVCINTLTHAVTCTFEVPK